jgi:myosin heavy subunit
VAANERSFHAFYALTASKSYETKGPENYIYLKQSGCYTATNIDDSAYFK